MSKTDMRVGNLDTLYSGYYERDRGYLPETETKTASQTSHVIDWDDDEGYRTVRKKKTKIKYYFTTGLCEDKRYFICNDRWFSRIDLHLISNIGIDSNSIEIRLTNGNFLTLNYHNTDEGQKAAAEDYDLLQRVHVNLYDCYPECSIEQKNNYE